MASRKTGEEPPKDGAVGARATFKLSMPSRAIREVELSRSTSTMWESIYSTSSLILGLSSPPSFSSFPPATSRPPIWAWMGRSSGSGTWVGSLKGEVLGRFKASTMAIHPYMNPICQALKMMGPLEFLVSLKPML